MVIFFKSCFNPLAFKLVKSNWNIQFYVKTACCIFTKKIVTSLKFQSYRIMHDYFKTMQMNKLWQSNLNVLGLDVQSLSFKPINYVPAFLSLCFYTSFINILIYFKNFYGILIKSILISNFITFVFLFVIFKKKLQ